MDNDTPQSNEKWVLYYYGFGACAAVACENTPEELMPRAGIGQPIKWIEQNGRYLGLPFNGEVSPPPFSYSINQDGERLYWMMSGKRPQKKQSEWRKAFDGLGKRLRLW